jgi:hypothetical protein
MEAESTFNKRHSNNLRVLLSEQLENAGIPKEDEEITAKLKGSKANLKTELTAAHRETLKLSDLRKGDDINDHKDQKQLRVGKGKEKRKVRKYCCGIVRF